MTRRNINLHPKMRENMIFLKQCLMVKMYSIKPKIDLITN